MDYKPQNTLFDLILQEVVAEGLYEVQSCQKQAWLNKPFIVKMVWQQVITRRNRVMNLWDPKDCRVSYCNTLWNISETSTGLSRLLVIDN